jgi:hypothetical protein
MATKLSQFGLRRKRRSPNKTRSNMKNIIFLYVLATTCLLLIQAACWPVDNCEEYPGGYRYSFTIPAEIYPKQDTFNIGDTIWIDIQMPDEIEEDISGNKMPVSNLDVNNLRCDFVGYSFDSLGRSLSYNPIGFFNISTIFGSSKQIGNGFTAHAILEFDKTSKKSLIGVVPQRSGEYAIVLSHNGGIILATGRFDDNFCYSYSNLYYNVNGPDSNNYHIVDKYGVDKVGTYEAFKKSGVFAFVTR